MSATFAESPDGKLYVRVQDVMMPLVALIDGLPMVFFGKGKTAYLAIDVAITWVKKEMECYPRGPNTPALPPANDGVGIFDKKAAKKAWKDPRCRYEIMLAVLEREKAKNPCSSS